MNISHAMVMFDGEAGVLLKDKKGFKFESKDGNIYYGYDTEDPETSNSLKVKILKIEDVDLGIEHKYMDEDQCIAIVEIGDTKLLGNTNYSWLWDEVDYREIEGIGTVYTGKNNKLLAVLIDKNERCIELAEIMLNIAQLGIDETYKYLPEELRNMQWKVGRANYEGKPISKQQRFKMIEDWYRGRDTYIDGKAVIIDNIGIGFIWDIETFAEKTGIFWNGDKYKFYEE